MQAILDAAAHVLVAERYDNANTNKIAARAGVSIGTLYQYFEDKDDIYVVLIQTFVDGFWEAVTQCPTPTSLRDFLSEFNSRLYLLFHNDAKVSQAIETLLNGPFRTQRDVNRKKFIIDLAALLERYREEITVDDLQLAAYIIATATEGVVSAASSELFLSTDFPIQVERLQLAYLTSKSS